MKTLTLVLTTVIIKTTTLFADPVELIYDNDDWLDIFTTITHRLTWNAVDMPAGSYIVQARFEGEVISRHI